MFYDALELFVERRKISMIIFLDGTFFLIVILVILGAVSSFFSALPSIIFTIVTIIIMIIGIFTIYWVFASDEADDKTVFEQIAGFLRGIMLLTIIGYSMALVDTGRAVNFADSKFTLLEVFHLHNKNEYMVFLIFAFIAIAMVSIPSLFATLFKRTQKIANFFSILTIVLIIAIYIGGFQLAVKDVRDNSYNTFDYEMEKYEIITDTKVYLDFAPGIMDGHFFKLGLLKAGQKVYENGRSIEKGGETYYQISDGKSLIGYVSEKDMNILYESGYALCADSSLYEVTADSCFSQRTLSGKSHIIQFESTGNIIGVLSAGTEVKFCGNAYNPSDSGELYCKIALADGTEGCVIEKNIVKIKKPVNY